MTRGPAANRSAAVRPAPRSHRRSVLPSGMRVVTESLPQARSVSVALFVGVGSRYEDADHAGLSHILEHMAFKGTRRYPGAGELSAVIEASGGSANASTDRELTVYSAKVPRDQASTALEVVAELGLRPLLRRADLAAEKPVIVDEIRMYIDSPSDHVFTMFDELLFGDHPLGREIAGTPRSVRRARRETVAGHWQRWYRPDRVVLAAAGAIAHDDVLRHAAGWWDADPIWSGPTNGSSPILRPPVPSPAGALAVRHRRLGQGNLCLGMPGVSRDDPDRWALEMLSAVLGDGMSSRLFLELRERRSLAYDVSTFASSYADIGTFGVHAGFDPDHAERVVAAILDELDRISSEPVSTAELDRARAYTRGRLQLRMEDSGAVAAWLGAGESLLPRIITVEEVLAHFDALTAADLLRVAQRLVRPELARLSVLGPFRSRRRFERMLRA